jgi:hypothetical protein
MTAVLKIKDLNNEWNSIQSLIGPKGASVTGFVRIGREGTEETGFLDTYRVDFSDGTYNTFVLQNGAKGSQGSPGPKGDVDFVTTTTLSIGSNATVSKTVDGNGKVTLNFGIPRGSGIVTIVDWGDDVS